MNKLSKAQRDQLISIAIGTVALVAALYYFGVTAMNRQLAATQQKTADMRRKLRDADALMHRENEISAMLSSCSDRLAKREAGLAPDQDAYAWLINTMNNFVQSRSGVAIESSSQPEISDEGLIPKFPYRWATFHLKGTGYYQDLGKFFADFENAYLYFRIENLHMTANSTPGVEAEKLSVTFDLVAPVTSSNPDIK